MGRWIPKGEWNYSMETKQVQSNKVNKCVETDGIRLFLDACRPSAEEQKWTWKEIYLS